MSDFGVKEMLAQLDALKDAVRDFAAREEKLNNDFQSRTAAAAKIADDAIAAQTKKLADNIDSENAAYETGKANLQTHFENRESRIHRAHAAARKSVMDAIAGEHGQLKDRIQANTQLAEQQRDNALADTVVTLENFRVKVADAAEKFEALTARAKKILGGGTIKQLLEQKRPQPDLSPDENQLFAQFEKSLQKIESDLEQFQKIAPPKLLRFTGGNKIKPLENSIGEHFAKARRLLDTAAEKAELTYQREQERIKKEFDATVREINQEWKQAVRGAMDLRDTRPAEIDVRARKIHARHEALHKIQAERFEKRHDETIARIKEQSEIETKKFSDAHSTKMASLEKEFQSGWQMLEADWKNSVLPLFEKIRAAKVDAEKLFPEWPDVAQASRLWENWKPPVDFKNAAQFGQLEIEIENLAEEVPKDKRLALLGALPSRRQAVKLAGETLAPPGKFSVPLALTYPQQGSILFETNKGGENQAVAAINNIIFRLLSTTPPGKANFTIFDPVGLGQNFAALMHLADYEEGAINSRIWTQTTQFEEKLAELNEHMEKVIQMYLRNEYATIAEYNASAGSIAEKYHFLVIASFPVNFSDVAAKRLRNIAANGARCGVYLLVHWDQRNAAPNDFVPDELRKNSVRILRGENNFYLANWHPAGTKLVLDAPPSPEFATKFLHDIGESSRNSTRVEVPFEQIAPPENKIWSEETSEELRVAIGRSGATKLQYLEIGKATRQHALIAGKTGSGKSTLFHIIITNLALWCSPEQVEFYLVDFKKGVEFKCYANRHLPHAKVVAIESDRAFGLSVLQKVDDELRRRGDLFRQLGVQDLAGYKRAGGREPLPRSLLMIDEFQEFFTEEDRVSQSAAVLLDRIVRQGRAFGIHVLLGSQTLGGAYTLARATIGQMVIRIALQCNEADAYLIMDQDNPAPRLLTRPGEGIYNDAAGALEGNSPFQAVWLSEEVRDDYLEKIRGRADEKQFPGPFVFEGSAPADVHENLILRDLLNVAQASRLRPQIADGTPAPLSSKIWLGAPNSIKGPTEAVFQRQSGSNLLIVGQSEERSLTILAVAMASLAAQFPELSAKFFVFDSTPPGFSERDFIEKISKAIPQETVHVSNSNLTEAMNELAAELKKRSDEESAAPEIFLFINGLQNFKKLRNEDEFSFSSSDSGEAKPGAILQSLINDGPAHGIHVIATCDTYNNVSRFLGRKTLTEFEMRVLFQMSASDSASLIDAPDASTLGLHRALYYNDREGYTEIFRPYARPGNDWIEEIARLTKS